MTPTEQAKTMVRRVAEALCDLERDGTDCIRPAAEWSDQQLKAQGYWQIARAAIGAMRAYFCDHGATYDMAGKSFEYCEGFAAAMAAMDKRFSAAALSEEGE